MVGRADRLHVADPPQRDLALAVLRRLDGVRLLQHALRPWEAAEEFIDALQRFSLIDLAGHDQHCVVRLIKLLIERFQPVDRHALNVLARTDGALPIVVPEISRGPDALLQDAQRVVLAHLEFVANHAEFRIEVLSGDMAVHHPVRFERQAELQILLGRRQRLEVVRPVVRGRPIELRSVILERLPNLRMIRRALELHMLKQVRHARLAVALMPRADEIRHVHGHRRLGRIGEEKHLEPVAQAILGDALDRGDLFRRRRVLRDGAQRSQQRDGGNDDHRSNERSHVGYPPKKGGQRGK